MARLQSLLLMACCTVPLAWKTNAEAMLLHLNALEYDGNVELDKLVDETSCVEGPPEDMDPFAPDAQTTIDDEECRALGRCHISNTLAGESVSYLFFPQDIMDVPSRYEYSQVAQDVMIVDVTIRVAAAENSTRTVELQIFDSDGQDAGPPKEIAVEGYGFQEFGDLTWRNVQLNAMAMYNEIMVTFVDGKVNMCSIKVSLSDTEQSLSEGGELGAVYIPTIVNATNNNTIETVPAPIPPTTWAALDYSTHDDIELVLPLDQIDKYCNLRDDGVHGKRISDSVCKERDSSSCAVAFTEPEEYVSYRFDVPSDFEGLLDFRVRASASNGGKRIRFEVRHAATNDATVLLAKRFEVPSGDGSWDLYSDIVWKSHYLPSGEYFLDVRFLTGHVNVCSVSVLQSKPEPTNTNQLRVPGLYSALNFLDYHDTSPESRKETCHESLVLGVGTQVVNDAICASAFSFVETGNVRCNIAFTEAGQSMTYFLKTDNADRIDISFRIASHDSHRRFLVELDPLFGGPTKEFFAPGLGFHSYDNVEWRGVDVGTSNIHELRVTFLDGRINFCAINIEQTRSR
ncbi:MAG: hypothetical protein SGILL_009560 [Bacillariaceae sp.]